MWHIVFILCLLLSSTIFAGESRRQMQVGITITEKSNSYPAGPKPAAGTISESEVSVPLPTERPAAISLRFHVEQFRNRPQKLE